MTSGRGRLIFDKPSLRGCARVHAKVVEREKAGRCDLAPRMWNSESEVSHAGLGQWMRIAHHASAKLRA